MGKKFNPLNKEEIISRYLAGAGANTIGKELGVGHGAIIEFLKKNGIRTRGSAEANRLLITQRTPEQNRLYTQAAHDANRGTKYTYERLCRRAKKIQLKGVCQSPYELELMKALRERGLEAIPQFAVGKYNVDLLVKNSVAVEIFGGGWHSKRDHRERNRYILNGGYSILCIWVGKNNLFDIDACVLKIKNKIAKQGSLIEMICCDGKPKTFYKRLENGQVVIPYDIYRRFLAGSPEVIPKNLLT